VAEPSELLAARALAAAEQCYQTAVGLHRQGRAAEADAHCAAALQGNPLHFNAWHLRGLIALKQGELDRGLGLLKRSLSINPNQPSAHCNLGNAHLSMGQAQAALECFEQALVLKPDYLLARYNRATALKDLRRLESALAGFEEVLALDACHVPSLNNHGLVLVELGRLEAALSSFTRAIELDARFSAARANQAAVLLQLRRPLEALEGFTKALMDNPGDVATLIQRAGTSERLHRNEAALADYRQALRLAPDDPTALKGAAGVQLAMGHAAAALASYELALELSPEEPDLQCGRGAALLELRREQQVALAFAEVLRGAPAHRAALGQLFGLRMAACDWQDYEVLAARLADSLRESNRVVNPPQLLYFDQPELHLACAREFVEARYAPDGALGACRVPAEPTEQNRIRVAYVSADFCDHPVAHQLVGVLERHDRARFEVIGFSATAWRRGIRAARAWRLRPLHRRRESERSRDRQ
jgi:protein O-GlcNAc transferase